jgi:hypothetical protein
MGGLGAIVLGLEQDDITWMGALSSGVWGAFIQNQKPAALKKTYF